MQFLDEDHNIIEEPYEGFWLSQSIGHFKYLSINSKTMLEFVINIKTLPNTYYFKGGFRTWANMNSPVYLESQLEIFKLSSIGKVYDSIWNLLNRATIHLGDDDWPENINPEIAKTYFNTTTKYQEVKLESMGNGEIYPWLEKLGIENFAQFIENIQKCKEHESDYNQDIYNFKLNAIKNGYLESICPWSGELLHSNQSFLIDNKSSYFFYRFIGHQVFYLIVGGVGGHKLALYFPSIELIINFIGTGFAIVCNTFKSYLISRWVDVINYLSDQKSKDLVGLTGTLNHFGHAILNELSSYQQLFEKNYLSKFKQILVGPNEFIPFNKLFPEFEVDKILSKKEDTLDTFTYIIKNNLFVIRPTNGGYLLSRNLAKRIYDASVNTSSPSCLQKIESAKKYFPLLWFEIRTNDRIWLNQAEGIAEIVNRLYSNYPNLGVIFAGWSSTDTDNLTDKHWIEKDQQVVEQSQALINPDIPTFAVVGHKIYEKIVWAGVANIHISTYGSGNIFAEIANKFIIVHANKRWYPASNMKNSIMKNSPLASESISIVPIEYIEDEDPNIHFHVRNYYCDWQGIYQEIVKMLNTQNLKQY